MTGKKAHAICVMCLIKWKAEALKKALKKALAPWLYPPPRGFFCLPIFPLIFSKMPSGIYLKLLNKTKKKMAIE